ncbi:MAG: DUF305 domain-containing protein [Rhizobiales bacterium]|nr:DUF305 domain-containing protein [Hyphomicrobiales bacterium]
MSYWRFAGMIATSTLVMFGLMYLNTFLITHVFFSETRTYMAIMMGGVMAIIMLAFMLSMYKNRSLNLAIFIGSAIVVAVSLWLVRSQVTVGDVSFMRAMIPHHSIAIMTSSRANIEDSRVRKLADEIVYAQDKEIAEMRYLIAQIEAEGPQQADAEQETPAALVSVDQAVSTPNVAVMDAGFLTPADIARVFPDGASCTFAFTTQSPAALAVGETSEGRSALLKIGGSLVQLAAAENAGQFSAPGMTASLEKLDEDWRADSRLKISLDQGLTAGYDGFSNCSG